jgi:Mrp family chromosome partitioning ATPase
MSAVQPPAVGAQIQDISTQLAQAQADLAQRQARSETARRAVETGRGYGANPEILNSPLIQRLREQEETLQRQQAEIDSRLGPNHPRVREARVQLGSTRAALRAEIERISRGSGDELAVARSRVASLEQSLARLQQQGGQIDQTEGRLRQLELEVNANRRVYEALFARAQQASVQDTVQIPRSRVIAAASAPALPAFPNVPVLAGASLVASILLSVGLALLRELMRRDYRNVIEAANHLRLAPLGVVPRLPRRTPRRLRATFADRQAYAHALRTILTWTSVSQPEGRHRALLIASAEAGEGKTELTINLARVLASTGYRVLVVDADLDRSALSTALGIQASAPDDHAMVLRTELGAATLVKPQPRLGFDVLRCMLDDPATSFALGPVIMRRVLATLKEEYDLVLIDTSAITQSQDAVVIGEFADAAIFVVRARKTSRRVARAALDMLRSAQVNVIGTVMTFAGTGRGRRRLDTIEHLRSYPRLQGPQEEVRGLPQ